MQVLCIGDLHFKVSNVEQTNEATKEILSKVMELKEILKLVVIMGDVLDTHNRMNVGPVNRAYSFVKSLSVIAPVIILVGNHDYINNSQFMTKEHSLVTLSEIPNVTVVDRVMARRVNGRKLVFSPYVPPGRFVEALNSLVSTKDNSKLSWRDSHCIFGHQEIFGCEMGGIVSTQGDKWLAKYPMLISGHIHKSHYVGRNVYYTGSAMQHDSVDVYGKHLVTVSLNDSLEINEFPLNLTRRKTYYITCEEFSKWRPKKGIMSKLVVRGSTGQIAVIKKSTRYKRLEDYGVVISCKVDGIVAEKTVNFDKMKSFKSFLNEMIEKDEAKKDLHRILTELS